MKRTLHTGILLAAFAGTILLGGTPTLQAETLEGAFRKALANHPRTKAAIANAEASYQEAMEVRGLRLPYLGLDGSFGPSYRDRNVEGLESGDWLAHREIRANLRQTIFQGGLFKYNHLGSEKRAEAAKVMERDIDEELALLVAEAYTGVLRATEQIRLAKLNVATHEDSQGKAQERFDGGRGTVADVDLVKARTRLARASVATREALLGNAEVRYEQLVGEKPANLAPITVLGDAVIPDSLDAADLSRSPAIEAANLLHEASELESRAAEGLWFPRFDIDTSGGVGHDVGGVRGQDDNLSALVVGSWDLYAGGSRKATRARMKARAEEAAALANDAELIARDGVGTALADRTGSMRSEAELIQYAESISSVVDAYEQQLEIGSRAILNVLDVKNEEFRSNSSVVDAQYARIMADYRVLAAQGKLVDTIAPGAGDADGAAGSAEGKDVVGDDQSSVLDAHPDSEMIASIGNEPEVEMPSAEPVKSERAGRNFLQKLFGTKPENAAAAAGGSAALAATDTAVERVPEAPMPDVEPAPAAPEPALADGTGVQGPGELVEATNAADQKAKPFAGFGNLFKSRNKQAPAEPVAAEAPAIAPPAIPAEAPAPAPEAAPVAAAPASAPGEEPVVYRNWKETPGGGAAPVAAPEPAPETPAPASTEEVRAPIFKGTDAVE